MNGYSEDLREKIVADVGGGISKSQAARTFTVSLTAEDALGYFEHAKYCLTGQLL